jgi:hypothetical protein
LAIRQYLTEFGLTPATRTRVRPLNVNPKQPVDPVKERYFGASREDGERAVEGAAEDTELT